jgi:hypothetical protein
VAEVPPDASNAFNAPSPEQRVFRMPPRAARISRLGSDEIEPPPTIDSGLVAPPPTPTTVAPPPPPPPTVAPPPPPAPTPVTEIKPITAVKPVTELKELKPTPREVTETPAPQQPVRTGPDRTFRPLTDKLAQRSFILSVIGLILFVLPVISLIGAIGGALSLRRIKRSDGRLVGEGTARLAMWIGVAGVLIGSAALGIYLLQGN